VYMNVVERPGDRSPAEAMATLVFQQTLIYYLSWEKTVMFDC
jgi:hypothetical protein